MAVDCNPHEPFWSLFTMDGCTILSINLLVEIHCHFKTWKSQDIFLDNSDCIRSKEESHLHLGWLEGE